MAQDRLDELDYYTLLEVEPSASAETIRAAWRRFALKFHPDRHADAEAEKAARAARIYRRGSEAFAVLSDPIKRRAYDVVLARGELRLTSDAQATALWRGEDRGPAARPTRSSATGARRASRRSLRPGGRARANPRPFTSPIARAHYARALEATKLGQHEVALRFVDAALREEPDHPTLLEARRRLHEHLGR